MIEFQEVLNLPLETLAIIAAGYLSYCVAYTGKDKYHRSLDAFFITTVFASLSQISASLIATVILIQMGPEDAAAKQSLVQGASIAGGFVFALLGASIWRKWGIEKTRALLRKTKVSHADANVSAWETVIGRETANPSAVIVLKTNGDKLMCERLDNFANEEFGPCIYGSDGSIALFVTHRKSANAADWEEQNPPDKDWGHEEDWGHEITFVPGSEIAEIRVRHGR